MKHKLNYYDLDFIKRNPDHIVNHVVVCDNHIRVELSNSYSEYSGILSIYHPEGEYSYLDMALEAQNYITLLPREKLLKNDPT
jgi:hypothetical protein